MVDPEHQRRGNRRARCSIAVWPGDPTPDLGRVVVATGAPADLTLYPDFGVMPVTGHWHMRRQHGALPRAARARGGRARPGHASCSSPERAVEEWERLEPHAIAHERPALHEFFARDRKCLATLSPRRPRDRALLGLAARRDRPGGRRRAGVPRAGRAGGARPGREDAGAGGAQPLLHDDRLVAPAAPARARLLRLLAELDHVLGTAARPRQVCTDAAALTYSEGMAESLKELGRQGARPRHPAAGGVPALQDRARASCRRSPGRSSASPCSSARSGRSRGCSRWSTSSSFSSAASRPGRSGRSRAARSSSGS